MRQRGPALRLTHRHARAGSDINREDRVLLVMKLRCHYFLHLVPRLQLLLFWTSILGELGDDEFPFVPLRVRDVSFVVEMCGPSTAFCCVPFSLSSVRSQIIQSLGPACEKHLTYLGAPYYSIDADPRALEVLLHFARYLFRVNASPRVLKLFE